MLDTFKLALFILFRNISFAAGELVQGQNFAIPATQQIEFVPLKKIKNKEWLDSKFPSEIDLRSSQSKVKSQGQRGACTYFTVTSLVESLIKGSKNQEIDLSEEYLAWAAKTKKKLRSAEEDSSVAVNAATIQDFGFMLEADLPYQQSWFDKGLPREGKMGKPDTDLSSYSHNGPSSDAKIFSGLNLKFFSVESSSIDIVRSLATLKAPVTLSILGHPEAWDKSVKTGQLLLTKKFKKQCLDKIVRCSGHAVLIVGYNLKKRIFSFKNSWGEDWGQQGYGTISFDYVDQMSQRKLLTGNLVGTFEELK